MMLAYIVAVFAGQQVVGREEIPIAGWNSGDVMFTCGVPGLPTLELDYSPTRKNIRFFQVREPAIEFELNDAVKSIFFEQSAANQKWVIRAEGSAELAKGLQNKTPITIDVTIRLPADKQMVADFSIRSAGFARQEANCGLAPARAPSRNMQ